MRPDLICVVLGLLLAAVVVGQVDRRPLVGIVVDPDGEPVVGALVEAWRVDGRATPSWRRGVPSFVGRTPTVADGRFAIHLSTGVPCRVVVDRAPFARWVQDDVIPGVALRIELQTPAVLDVRLVPRDDGAPVTGVFSGRRRFGNRITGAAVVLGKTDEHGRMRLDRMAAGVWRIDVEPDDAIAPPAFEVTLVGGQTVAREIEVDRGVVLRGRVTDAVTGEPIEGAVVSRDSTRRRGVRSGDDGRFEMRGYGGLSALTTCCTAPGYVKYVAKNEGVDLGELSDPFVIDFRLERGDEFAGKIVDPRGRPMAEVEVVAVGGSHDDGFHYGQWVDARTDVDGAFRASGLRPDLDHVLVIRLDGFASLAYALPPPDAHGVRRAGSIRMRRPHIVRGRVLTGDESPVAGARVVLSGVNEDRDRLAPAGPLATGQGLGGHGWAGLIGIVGRREVRTTADGEFVFGDAADGQYEVSVHSETGERIAGDRVRVTEDVARDSIILTVPR